MVRLPAQHGLDEFPRITEGSLGRFRLKKLFDRARVDRRLADRRKAKLLEQARGDDKPDRLDVVKPFNIRVSIELSSHCAHPDMGQR